MSNQNTRQTEDSIPQIWPQRLRNSMADADITVSQLSELTGISKGQISRYRYDYVCASPAYIQRIADALHITVNYLTGVDYDLDELDDYYSGNNLTVAVAARLMNKSKDFVYIGLQQGIFPFGYALQVNNRWSYYISPVKFTEYTGIKIPGQDGASA